MPVVLALCETGDSEEEEMWLKGGNRNWVENAKTHQLHVSKFKKNDFKNVVNNYNKTLVFEIFQNIK